MNDRQFVYDIVIGPSISSDTERPIDLLDDFKVSQSQLEAFL